MGDLSMPTAVSSDLSQSARLVDSAALDASTRYADDRPRFRAAAADYVGCDPATVVPDYAAAESFDGLFVGHRGLSERYENLVGSVAKAILERSSVPVTVVR